MDNLNPFPHKDRDKDVIGVRLGERCHAEGEFKPLLFSHSWTTHYIAHFPPLSFVNIFNININLLTQAFTRM